MKDAQRTRARTMYVNGLGAEHIARTVKADVTAVIGLLMIDGIYAREPGTWPSDNAGARRVAACLRACEGLDVETLEALPAGALADFVEAARGMF